MNAEYLCPVLTAFTDDGHFDSESQHELYDRLISAGVDGAVVLGSSGEFPSLSIEDCRIIGMDAISYIQGRIKVFIGTGRLDIDDTVNLSNEMIDAGASGVIVVGPYYFRAGEEGVFSYFSQVASRVHGDIIIYNYPETTGIDVGAGTLERLIESCPNIIGIKDTVESATHTQRLINAIKGKHPDFKVYSGFDNNFIPVVFSGGDGVIAAMANVMPWECAAWTRAVRDGDIEAVASIHAKVSRLMGIYSISTPFMPAMKAILGMQGLGISERCLLPAMPVSETEKAKAREVANYIKEHCND